MKKWLPALLVLMPRWLASVSTAVLLLLSVAVLAWLYHTPTVVMGLLVDHVPIDNTGKIVLEVSDPFAAVFKLNGSPAHHLAAVDEVLFPSVEPDLPLWVMASGEAVRQAGAFTVLQADQLATLALPGGIARSLNGPFADMAAIPLVALAIGAFLILAGPLLTRLLSAITLGALLGIAVWHGLHHARFMGQILMIDPLIDLTSWLAVAIGLVIGLRARRDRINILVERLILMLMVILAGPIIAAALGLAAQPLVWTMALLTLLTPVPGYALLGGFALAQGMHATPMATWLIIGLSLLIAILLRAAFADDHDPVLRRISRHVQRGNGRISLLDLLDHRGNAA